MSKYGYELPDTKAPRVFDPLQFLPRGQNKQEFRNAISLPSPIGGTKSGLAELAP